MIDLLQRKNTTTIDKTIPSPLHENQHQSTPLKHNQESILISRNASNVVSIASSARGNLGPPSVLNQDPPGDNWLEDRWQAASDMHGSAIPGSHWVVFQFTHLFDVTKLVLDWETAYSEDYRIETRVDPPTSSSTTTTKTTNGDVWCVLYDTKEMKIHDTAPDSNHYPHLTHLEYGQSPGVKEKLPLHIIHSIDWESNNDAVDPSLVYDSNAKCHSMRYLRIFIRKSAKGWGVSLWQVDIYGRLSSAG